MRRQKQLFFFLQGYALLLILGGLLAHGKQYSSAIVPSVLLGCIMQVGAWLTWKKKAYALFFNLFCVFGLTLFFIYRWSLLKKFYPPGFLTCISLFLLFKIAQALFERKKVQQNVPF